MALRLVPVVLGALMLQLTVLVEVRIAGVAPELLALVAVLAGLFAGAHNGSSIAFVAGLLWDLYLSTPLGLAAVSFALVAYALGLITEDLFHDTRTRTVVVALVGTAASVTVYAVLGAVMGQSGLIDDDLAKIVLLSSLMNAVIALPVAPVMRWAVSSTGRDPRRLGAVVSGTVRGDRRPGATSVPGLRPLRGGVVGRLPTAS